MTDTTFAIIWILSFFLYLLIYTYHIPRMTQKRIEVWLRDSESDETLLLALDVIVKRIREQTLIDFDEFMLPRARESLQKFWSGAMGNAVKEIGKTEEGSKLSMLSNMADSLKDESWFVQAFASKMLPIIEKATKTQPNAKKVLDTAMGLQK